MMLVKRTASLTGDFFGLPMAEATALAASPEAQRRLQPTVDLIGAAPQVAHVDETCLRVAGSLHGEPILCSHSISFKCAIISRLQSPAIRCLVEV
jgi:hypothetical protein